MAALYAAVRDNRRTIDASAIPFDPTYMHVGAVLEDPATGAIQALYPGPGYPGAKYNGTGKVITASYCKKIACEVNMAVYNREQVGSSFKPYILSAAVKQGMNVQTSTLNGYNNLCIPPDSAPSTYPVTAIPTATALGCQTRGYYPVHNDSAAENGPYTPQIGHGGVDQHRLRGPVAHRGRQRRHERGQHGAGVRREHRRRPASPRVPS